MSESSHLENEFHRAPMTEVDATVVVYGNGNTTADIITDKQPDTVTEKPMVTGGEEEDEAHETNAFQRLIKRAQLNIATCNSVPTALNNENAASLWAKNTTSGVPFLPEFGIVNALEDWLSLSEDEKKVARVSNSSSTSVHRHDDGLEEEEDGMCHLPPRTSCDVSMITAVLMSHTTDRLQTLIGGLKNIAKWSAVGEIILVWNSDRSNLETDVKGKRLLGWHNDSSHPLRIFFSLENGLPNCLLNRYHPMIKPKYEALMYFDDDGPFFPERVMVDVGFELWRRNSDVQVGSFPRNMRFVSPRMKEAQQEATKLSIRMVTDETNGDKEGPQQPQFTPICRDAVGDKLEYNYFEFPQWVAHFILPSGSFLHRNFLCFMFHPALEELRQYVLEHPTKPDDITMSTLVSHLAGKAPRVFTRRVHEPPKQEQNRRKLLWSDNKEIWANIREEAANSVSGYFGAVNPGSVGWCAGTKFQQQKQKRGQTEFFCAPEFPALDLVPWVNEGGLGHDQCDPPIAGGKKV